MSKSKAQGTRFETALTNALNAYGLQAQRLAEGGTNDRGDIELIGTYPEYIVALAHKRLVNKGGRRRVPDGEPVTVSVNLNDFLDIMKASGLSAIIECKATERLNTSRALRKAIDKAKP